MPNERSSLTSLFVFVWIWVWVWACTCSTISVWAFHNNGNGMTSAFAFHVPPNNSNLPFTYPRLKCRCRCSGSGSGSGSGNSRIRATSSTSVGSTVRSSTYTEMSPTESTRSHTPQRQRPTSTSTCSLHLISLPPLVVSDKPESCTPKVVRDLWKWKDVVLGDGRDYFIPKPRALRALSDVLIGSSTSTFGDGNGNGEVSGNDGNENGNENGHVGQVHVVREAAILSNCARLDVLVALESHPQTQTKPQTPPDLDSDDGYVCAPQNTNTNSNKDDRGRRNDDHGKCPCVPLPMTKEEAAKWIVADCLLNQLESFERKRSEGGGKNTLMEGLSSFFDLPGMVVVGDNDDANDNVNGNEMEQYGTSAKAEAKAKAKRGVQEAQAQVPNVQELTSLLTSTHEPDAILRHFSTVAAGMAPRASRPDRPVEFRPFSSRDAHIMLQLKRTADVVASVGASAGANAKSISTSRNGKEKDKGSGKGTSDGRMPRMKIVLDTALGAGKAARDPNTCPILGQLREYGGEGRYSVSAPPHLAKEASERVMELAIEPAVQRGVDRLAALEYSNVIAGLRKSAEELLLVRTTSIRKIPENSAKGKAKGNGADRSRSSGEEKKRMIVNKLLHQPCMDIRNGNNVDVDAVLLDIQRNLERLDE